MFFQNRLQKSVNIFFRSYPIRYFNYRYLKHLIRILFFQPIMADLRSKFYVSAEIFNWCIVLLPLTLNQEQHFAIIKYPKIIR